MLELRSAGLGYVCVWCVCMGVGGGGGVWERACEDFRLRGQHVKGPGVKVSHG